MAKGNNSVIMRFGLQDMYHVATSQEGVKGGGEGNYVIGP